VRLTDRGRKVAACVRAPTSYGAGALQGVALVQQQTLLVIPNKPLARGHTFVLDVTAGAAHVTERITVGRG
jgi:hypothetical protein